MTISCDRIRDLAPGFVLGALDPADMAGVREHIARCRKPHPELRELGGVVPYLAIALSPVEPPRRLRSAVLAAARADLRTRRAAGAPAEPASGRVVELAGARRARTRRVALWLARAAAAVALVGLVGYVAPSEFVSGGAKTDGRPVWQVIEPGSRTVVLQPQGDSGASGIAFIRPNGHLLVYLHGLTSTRGDEVYVVWLSADGNAPVAGTSFRVDESGKASVEMASVPRASRLGITITRESWSGSAEPIGPIVAGGTISL
jgi:hypothetical protein